MPVRVKDVLSALEAWAPPAWAEEWDNVGLLIGEAEQEVRTALVALDATKETIGEAAACGAQLLITHHPFVFHPIKQFAYGPDAGHIALCWKHGISVISMHTNLDVAPGGVNDALCEVLGIENAVPIVPLPDVPEAGSGRIGTLAMPMAYRDFVALAKARLKAGAVRASACAGDVQTIAVCGGAGAFLAEQAREKGADVLLTADVRHHEWLAARESGIALIDAGHGPTERVVLPRMIARLQISGKMVQYPIDIRVSRFSQCPYEDNP